MNGMDTNAKAQLAARVLHAMGLDKYLARLLNEPEVRTGLQSQGIEIPASTVFIAALHDTTTDEIEGFDLDLLAPSARTFLANMQSAFAQAGDQVRHGRAPSLGLNLSTAFKQR